MAPQAGSRTDPHVLVALGTVALFVLVALFVSVIPKAAHLSVPELLGKPVAVDAAAFPDDAFRSYVSSRIDQDGDGYLSSDEVAAVRSIGRYDQGTYRVVESGLADSGVRSLQGIGTFYNLESLVASGNAISELDMRGNPSLRYVDLRGNSGKVYIDFDSENVGAQVLVDDGSEAGGDSSGLDFVVAEGD